jgi:hypothetical protein
VVDVVTDPGSESTPAGFVEFFRGYAKTWVHAVATAGLTAFGTLTVVHRGFVALALAAYAVPPVALYLSRSTRAPDAEEGGTDAPPVASDATGGGSSATGGHPDGTGGDETVGEGTGADGTPTDPTVWTTADVPIESTLFDVAVTPAVACGVGEDGLVLVDRGDGWSVALEDGPGADGNTLRGVDATADGAAVWTAGDGGAIARIDAGSGRHVDHSAPAGITDAWVDVAVGGERGAETVLLVNGSGAVVRGRYRDGEVAWTDPVKPGGGSSFGGVDFADESIGYLCDTSDGVFRTGDGGETFRRVGIGGADGTLTDVAATAREACLASADDGVVHRYDGTRWTPDGVDDGPLLAVASRGEYAVASGDGVVHERTGEGGGWDRTATQATGALHGIAVGDDRAIAVGDGGVVVELRR